MTRKEEINDFIADYLEQYNGDSYEAYAEKEDIARACQNAIDWVDRTLIEKACEWLTKHAKKYYFNKEKYLGTEELVEDFKLSMEM